MQIFSFPGSAINRDSSFDNLGGQQASSRNLATLRSSSSRENVISRTFAEGDGLKVFEATISKRFQQSASVSVAKVVEADRPNSAESVANNILGFIERRLRLDEASGASPEELEARLNEGLEGFKKGFAEAEEQLKALSLLTPEVEDAIGTTFDLVTAGIEDLRERFVGGNEPADEVDTSGIADGVRGVNSDFSGVAVGSASYSFAQSNSFSFQVETADGDTVTIQAGSQSVFASRSQFGAASSGGASVLQASVSAASQQSERFSLSVEGELDAGELAAINDLLGRVENLSSDFFAGDVEGAFNQALGLGYNTDELVGYSLNLRQVQVERATVAYGQVSPASAPVNPLAQSIQPLGGFVRDVLEAVETASPFGNPGQLLSDLAQQFENLNQDRGLEPSQRQRGGGFSDLVQAIVDRLGG